MRLIIFYYLLQSINVNDEINGRPPLLYAADYGQADVIEYLIKSGADVNVSILFYVRYKTVIGFLLI